MKYKLTLFFQVNRERIPIDTDRRPRLGFGARCFERPAVAALGHVASTGNYAVYGKPSEIGQIYTSIAGLLNLLCIVNAVYLAHLRGTAPSGD